MPMLLSSDGNIMANTSSDRMPPSHNGIAPVLRTGPYGPPGSIPGGGVSIHRIS